MPADLRAEALALCEAVERAFSDYVTDGVNETPAVNESYRQARALRAALAAEQPSEAPAPALAGQWSAEKLTNATDEKVFDLALQLHSRALASVNRAQHEAYVEARIEVLRRLAAARERAQRKEEG